MEQKFGINSLNLQVLREFCEHEGKMVEYRKGDQLEREGDPARWFAFVTEGCFKYVKYGVSDDKAHITWFSFESEFVCDYPTFLYGRPSRGVGRNRHHHHQPALFRQSTLALPLRTHGRLSCRLRLRHHPSARRRACTRRLVPPRAPSTNPRKTLHRPPPD